MTEPGRLAGRAREELERAADAWARAGDGPRELQVRSDLGNRLLRAGETAAAIAQFRQVDRLASDAVVQRLASSAQLSVGQALLSFGSSLLDGGGSTEAARPLEAALTIFERLGASAWAGNTRDTLITHAARAGRWDEALRWCEQQIGCAEREAIPERSAEAAHLWREWELRAHYQWARGLGLLEDTDGALPHALQAAELASALGLFEVEAHMRFVAGHSLVVARRYRPAVATFERCVVLYHELGSAWEEAASCRKLGEIVGRLRPESDTQLVQAMQLAGRTAARWYARAAECFEGIGEDEEAAEAWYRAAFSQMEASFVARERSDLLQAAAWYECAARLHRPARRWWGLAVAEAGLAVARQQLGDLMAAIAAQRRAIRALARAHRTAELASGLIALALFQKEFADSATEPERHAARDESRRTFRRALRTLAHARSTLLYSGRAALDESHNTIVRVLLKQELRVEGHSFESEQQLREQSIWAVEQLTKARQFQDDVALAALAEETGLQSLRAELVTARDERDSLWARFQDAESVAARHHLRQRRRELQDVIDGRERELRDRAQLIVNERGAIADIGAPVSVSADELAACLQDDESYIGFLWNDIDPIRLTVTRATGLRIERVLSVGDDRAAFDQWVRRWAEAGCDPAAHDGPPGVADHLIAELPASVTTLLISPDGPLTAVPWHALPTAGGARLGDRYAISMTPSASLLVGIRQGGPLVGAGQPYLGVACNSDGTIPAVDVEVQHIAERFFGGTAGQDFYSTGEAARLFDLRGHVSLLHLACHSTHRSLALPAGETTHPHQLADLGLKADILLLTGCRIGQLDGELTNEFMGVVRELLIATGARAAVVSSANVRDDVGILFADTFVAALTGQRPTFLASHNPRAPLTVGEAVTRTGASLRMVAPADLASVRAAAAAYGVEAPALAAGAVEGVDWSLPWYVIGDPSATLQK